MLWLYPIQVEESDKKGLENTLLADLKCSYRTLGSKRQLKEKSHTIWKAKTKTLHTKADKWQKPSLDAHSPRCLH